MGVIGGDKWLKRLRNAAKVERTMDQWANESAAELAQEARILVDTDGIPSPNHIVSAPGNPPNSDSGALSASIQPVDLPEPGHAAISVGEEYGLYLELGTSRMAERPFMRPATAIMRKPLLIDAARRVRDVIRKP